LPQYSGIEVELADLVIYVMVMAKRRGLRIPEAIVDKMRFNTTREFMHGRKF
jgi:NTP pyrophosphatase (non-canonical NTP hydrolase)